MSAERPNIAAIEAMLEKASGGPWQGYDAGEDARIGSHATKRDVCRFIYGEVNWGDFAFIAAARSDVPALLAYVRALEAGLAVARATLERSVLRCPYCKEGRYFSPDPDPDERPERDCAMCRDAREALAALPPGEGS